MSVWGGRAAKRSAVLAKSFYLPTSHRYFTAFSTMETYISAIGSDIFLGYTPQGMAGNSINLPIGLAWPFVIV